MQDLPRGSERHTHRRMDVQPRQDGTAPSIGIVEFKRSATRDQRDSRRLPVSSHPKRNVEQRPDVFNQMIMVAVPERLFATGPMVESLN